MTEINKQAREAQYTPKKIQTDEGKSESTKAEYLKEAEGFLVRELDKNDIPRTARNICRALEAWSQNVTPGTYRKKQCELEFHQYKHKFFAAAEKIRNTRRIGYGEAKKKQKRCKSITEKEHILLLTSAYKKGDKKLACFLNILYHTGLRPCELSQIEYYDNGNMLALHLAGARKNIEGTRSIEKEISLKVSSIEKKILKNSIEAVKGMTGKELSAMKSRMSRLTRKVFPKRKSPFPSFYSYRYQLGSDLKRSMGSSDSKTLRRKEAAAIMGHRSQNSIQYYGFANGSGGLKRGLPAVSQESVNRVNDDYHETEYLQKQDDEYVVPSSAEYEHEMVEEKNPHMKHVQNIFHQASLRKNAINRLKHLRNIDEKEYKPY